MQPSIGRAWPGVAPVLIALALPGCMGSDSSGGGILPTSLSAPSWLGGGEEAAALTPAEQRLRDDARTFNETVFGGIAYNAMLGAALGGVLGFLSSGGDLSQTATYAAIGGAGGGVYGAIDGYRTATKQEAARAQIREIELMVDKVEAENARIEQSIQTTDLVVAETRGKLAAARKKLANQEITAAEWERDVSRAEDNVAELDRLIAGVQERRDQFSSVAEAMRNEGEDTAKLETEIAKSTQQLAQLQSERDLLAQDLEVSRIG
jgi:outer membrane lipoprotein SlyB